MLTPFPKLSLPLIALVLLSPLLVLAQSTGGLGNLQDFDYWADRCRTLAKADQPEQAMPACEQAIVLRSGDKDLWLVYTETLQKLGRSGEAAVAANMAYRRFDNRSSQALTYRCQALLEIRQYVDALATCDQALTVNENWGDVKPQVAWFGKGLSLVRTAQVEAGIKAYNEALKLEPQQSGVLAHRCQAWLQLKKYDSALTDCRQALAVNTDWGGQTPTSAWNAQAAALRDLKKLDEAVVAYDQSIQLDPKQPIVWAKQGLILRELNRDADALVAFNQAVQYKPDYTLALVNQCALLNQFGQYEGALKACETAIQGDGSWGPIGPAQAWDQQANALAGLQRLEEALAAAERAVNMAPNYTIAWNNRAVILWSLEQYPDALDSVDQALKLRQDYARAWANRGRILRDLNRNAEAIRAYEEALKLDPEDADAWANRSAALWQMKRYDLALYSADRSLVLAPKSLIAWFNRGAALSSLKRYSEAVEAYDRVLKLDETNTESLTAKGLALIAIGDDKSAIPILQRSLQINSKQEIAEVNLKDAIERFRKRQQAELEQKQNKIRQQQSKK